MRCKQFGASLITKMCQIYCTNVLQSENDVNEAAAYPNCNIDPEEEASKEGMFILKKPFVRKSNFTMMEEEFFSICSG